MTTPYGPFSLVEEIREYLAAAPLLSELVVADLDHAPNLDPPTVVVGPPSWNYRTPASGGGGPAEYTLTVFVVVGESENALQDLLRLTQLVARVLDEPPGLAVQAGRPTTFPAGSTELPAYALDLGMTA